MSSYGWLLLNILLLLSEKRFGHFNFYTVVLKFYRLDYKFTGKKRLERVMKKSIGITSARLLIIDVCCSLLCNRILLKLGKIII